MKGIDPFRKDHSIHTSTCSLWGTWVRPFPSLRTKMKDYIKEHKVIMNPFAANRECPTRTNPLPFVKKPKIIPTKRSHMETKHDIKKLNKPRKVDKGHSEMFQYNGFPQSKTVETMHQNPIANPASCIVSNTYTANSFQTYLCAASYNSSSSI